MKRLLALALCAAMCLTGAACAETVGKTGMYNENSIPRRTGRSCIIWASGSRSGSSRGWRM